MNGVSTVSGGMAWTRQLTAQWRTWIRANLGITIVMSIAAFAFGWVWNTYIMAVGLEGYVAEGQQTIATAEGKPANALFWLLFFALLSGLISYGWQRGWRQLGTDLASLPRQFAATLSSGRTAAISLVLWGMAISLLIATVVSSAVSLALGLVLLTLSATPIGVILNLALVRLWKGISGLSGPNERLLSTAPFMVMAGEGFGLVLDWVFDSWVIGLIAGVICVVLSLVLGRTGTAAAAIVIIGGGVVLTVLNAKYAFADDGGWLECYTNDGDPCSEAGIGGVFAWFGSEGSGPVMAYSTVGGAFAGVGTAIGAGFGSAAASVAVTGTAGAAAAAASSAIPTQQAPQDAAPDQQAPPEAAAGLETQPDSRFGQPPQTHDASGGVPQQPTPPGIDDLLPDAPDKRKKKDEEE